MLSASFGQKVKNTAYKQWSQKWLKRRIPPSIKHTLHRKNIFIFPSRAGFGFLLTLLLLWLLGTNYQNNLILLLTFLLLSLMHTCIFYTYGNFSGLSIELKPISTDFTASGFAHNLAKITFVLRSQHSHHNIILRWPDIEPVTINLHKHQTKTVTLFLPLKERGWFSPPRLTLSTHYPLGLLTAWTHLDMDACILVYPQPVAAALPEKQWVAISDADENSDEVGQKTVDMADDISHLREYIDGDPLRHIAWKTYAKGQGLATKVYESVTQAEQQQWLKWDDFSGFSTEVRLSKLCDCVLQAEDKNYLYGLMLPELTIPLGNGEKHKQQLLRELALFGKYKNSQGIQGV